MLLIEPTGKVINTNEIARGSLIYAKHMSWPEGKTGVVTNVTEKQIRVLYLPSIQNVQNHFHIMAEELANNEWMLRYSSDGLDTVSKYGE